MITLPGGERVARLMGRRTFINRTAGTVFGTVAGVVAGATPAHAFTCNADDFNNCSCTTGGGGFCSGTNYCDSVGPGCGSACSPRRLQCVGQSTYHCWCTKRCCYSCFSSGYCGKFKCCDCDCPGGPCVCSAFEADCTGCC
nr:hypothetical protein [uncultured bacterium]